MGLKGVGALVLEGGPALWSQLAACPQSRREAFPKHRKGYQMDRILGAGNIMLSSWKIEAALRTPRPKPDLSQTLRSAT